MSSLPSHLLRSVLLAATLLAPLTAAPESTATADRASQLLATHGTLPIASAGPYVSSGTFRIQVAAKLGRPDLQLTDGTWIYHQRRVSDSTATGSLLVRFDAKGRVSSLHLASAAAVAALRTAPAPADARLAAR